MDKLTGRYWLFYIRCFMLPTIPLGSLGVYRAIAPAIDLAPAGPFVGSGSLISPFVCMAALIVALVHVRHIRSHLSQALDRISELVALDSETRAIQACAGGESAWRRISHRLTLEHPVTGLPTRECLLEQMRSECSGVVGLVALDDLVQLTAIDPANADRMIARCAARLRKMLPERRQISQIDRGYLAIWYGSENEADIVSELDAAAYALSENVNVDGQWFTPKISTWISRYDANTGTSGDAFLNQSIARHSLGVAPVLVSQPTVEDGSDMARRRFTLEQDLRQAIAGHELRLEFQPLVDVVLGRVIGAEALLRWDHPSFGLIMPSEFVPIVETTDLADPIGLWVLNAAVRQAKRWSASGNRNLTVAVNVAASQFRQSQLPVMVQRILSQHDLPPGLLEIELTESVALSDAANCARIFKHLRTIGVKLAVDDFGTGYAGFGSLRALQFDKIKIDRQFVTEIDSRRESQTICQSILALGRGLGLHVLAEGVERREEFEWLRRQGCRYFQGYYFARPLTAEAFAEFARAGGQLAALIGAEPEIGCENERRSA